EAAGILDAPLRVRGWDLEWNFDYRFVVSQHFQSHAGQLRGAFCAIDIEIETHGLAGRLADRLAEIGVDEDLIAEQKRAIHLLSHLFSAPDDCHATQAE